MKFFADAHISVELVAMLRRLGHEVRDAAAIPPRMPDEAILRQATEENRVVLTADKDFGELIFVHRLPSPGVVLIRLTLAHEPDRVALLERCWPAVMSRLPGHFVTVTDHRVRARPIDPAPD